jgi:hypothetical protein
MVNDAAVPRDYPVELLQVNFLGSERLENGSLICFPSRIPAPAFLALSKSILCTAPAGRPGFVFDYEAKVYASKAFDAGYSVSSEHSAVLPIIPESFRK